MSSNLELLGPCLEYDDDVLYGSRRDAAKIVELTKNGTTSECVMYSIRCPYVKETWDLRRLVNNDPRIRSMLDCLAITHALPLQRHGWPKIDHSPFPVVFISPSSTGKTYTHLLYIVGSEISANPIAKTDEMLFSNDPLGASFKIIDSNKLKLQETSQNEQEQPIDHENFDFNSLGIEDETQANGKETSSGDQDGWGLKSEEHYEVNPDDFITHPKYIIVSSSQQQVEILDQAVDKLKIAAYGIDKISAMRLKSLPPVVRTVNVHHDDEKLALRCNAAEILLATPGALMRCLRSNYVTLAKCKKLIFEDLDLTLQLHNFNVREIMKLYLIIQTSSDLDLENGESVLDKENFDNNESNDMCRLYLFSKKWTDLVKQCVSTVSLQRTLIFGSIAEAAIYANVKFELEIYSKEDQLKLVILEKLLRYLETQEIVAIVCNTEYEAETICEVFKESNFAVYHCKASGKYSSQGPKCNITNRRPEKKIYVMSDSALSVLVDCWAQVSYMSCIIHYSMPDDMLIFDQRFRLMHHFIREERKNLTTVMLVKPSINIKLAKELYDLISRSSVTNNSTKLALKDLISERYSPICWRWASTGLCRLEKLSRNDRFGSYCSDRHSLGIERRREQSKRWPTSGQCTITITNLISPNEFYFWFDSHRDKNSEKKEWTKLKNTGKETMKWLQVELDLFKDTPSCSVPIKDIRQGQVYAIYLQQDVKVDRIILLEPPRVDFAERYMSPHNYDKQYSRQVRVFKVDYGVQLDVYLRNIIELPETLTKIEFQCHRGFIIGYKPTDSEPNWLYKAKKFFFDQVSVSNLLTITVWMRLNSNNCFWFEDMVVSRWLENIDGIKLLKVKPHNELVQAGLATRVTTEPSCLPPSDRLLTLSKWHVSKSAEFARFAFLRRDKPLLDIFVLDVNQNFELGVRSADYNKLLINLEDRILEDYKKGKLEPLKYCEKDVYCLTKITLPIPPGTKSQEPDITLNRCKILDIIETQMDLDCIDVKENKYLVRCLDHNDEYIVEKTNLYHAAPDYLSQLPFQAIKCTLANLNSELLKDSNLSFKVRELIYDMTRDANDELIRLLCTLNKEGQLEIYLPVNEETHEPLGDLFKKRHGIDLLTSSMKNK